MRLYVDLGSHDPAGKTGRIIKYDTTPEPHPTIPGFIKTTINGQYVFEVPEGAPITVDDNSYLLPQDAGSIPSQAAQEFLVRYPMYDHVLFNFFLDNDDIDAIDMATGIPVPTPSNTTPPLSGTNPPNFSRCKIGRSSGSGPIGMAPNRLEILGRHIFKTLPQYGCVISKNIDITSFNPSNPGTDEVMVWWRVARLETSEDVNTEYGSGRNIPSLNSLVEIDQEDDALLVYVSNDDGVTWYETPYLEPIDLVSAGTDIRIAFVNTGVTPINLLGYCLVFPDLP